MVAAMAYRDKDVGVVPAGSTKLMGTLPCSTTKSKPDSCDWRCLYERALKRAEAAEARAEELKCAEVSARATAGNYKSMFEAARRKRLEAVRDANESRRTSKNARTLHAEVVRLRKLLADLGIESGRHSVLSLRRENARLRKEVTMADAALRKAAIRSRRHKTTIARLSKEKVGLSRTVKRLRRRSDRQGAKLAKLHATRAVLSKRLFGRSSEQQEKPRTGRPRGQRRGVPGHGRTDRFGLEERIEEHNPPVAARTCSGCGKPYVANGADESSVVEIEVRAHRRVIRRRRWRRGCECACSPVEVSVPPAPRLFANTPYGISVWTRFLFEHHACRRPLHRVAAWLSDQGLPIAPGTLAGSMPRFVPLFEPLAEAIRAHQNEATLRHADETTWRAGTARERSVEPGLVVDVGQRRCDLLPHRSVAQCRGGAQAARRVAARHGDRLRPLQRLQEAGAPARRTGDFIVLLGPFTQGCDRLRGRSGAVDTLVSALAWADRLDLPSEPGTACALDATAESQSPAFEAAQRRLEAALENLFVAAERELADLDDEAREGKPLRSLLNHREGLSVFLDRPPTPLDNNIAERVLRGPVIGRKLSFGSDSETGARFTALMYSVIGTLNLNGVDVLRWLDAWLEACAHNGGRPPDEFAPCLPWSMDEARRRELAAPT